MVVAVVAAAPVAASVAGVVVAATAAPAAGGAPAAAPAAAAAEAAGAAGGASGAAAAAAEAVVNAWFLAKPVACNFYAFYLPPPPVPARRGCPPTDAWHPWAPRPLSVQMLKKWIAISSKFRK